MPDPVHFLVMTARTVTEAGDLTLEKSDQVDHWLWNTNDKPQGMEQPFQQWIFEKQLQLLENDLAGSYSRQVILHFSWTPGSLVSNKWINWWTFGQHLTCCRLLCVHMFIIFSMLRSSCQLIDSHVPGKDMKRSTHALNKSTSTSIWGSLWGRQIECSVTHVTLWPAGKIWWSSRCSIQSHHQLHRMKSHYRILHRPIGRNATGWLAVGGVAVVASVWSLCSLCSRQRKGQTPRLSSYTCCWLNCCLINERKWADSCQDCCNQVAFALTWETRFCTVSGNV